MRPRRSKFAGVISLFACAALFTAARAAFAQGNSPAPHASPHATPHAPSPDDHAVANALCPIVYQVDRSPGPRGYRYLFYGNAFFINKDGYLLTAAHVLSQLHGGQPYILLRGPSAPPHFVQAAVVAIDREHDVAILRATPNPFAGADAVSFLQLAREFPVPGQTVRAEALRPIRPRDSYTLEPSVEEQSAGEVLRFEFSQIGKARSDTELFLFNHAVQLGQSGAPVVEGDSHQVVGLVEGQWLRDTTTALAAPKGRIDPRATEPNTTNDVAVVPGAVLPIHYAIALLQQRNIAWHATSESIAPSAHDESAADALALPAPLSLVPARFPSQSLFGGEVLLDALVGRTGNLSDLRVVSGVAPFLDPALAAVRTWTLSPAHAGGRAADARILIAFQFVQPTIAKLPSTNPVGPARPPVPVTRNYDHEENSKPIASSHAAAALTTVEPEYPQASALEGSVILYETLDEGKLASVEVVDGVEPLASAASDAAARWRFAPAMHLGAAIDSAAIVVVTFREPIASSHTLQ